MTTTTEDRVYHRLVVVADPGTDIWLVDDCWHLVQQAVGTLDTSALQGSYFLQIGESGPQSLAYPIELLSDLQLTKKDLDAGPKCDRQPPVFPDEQD